MGKDKEQKTEAPGNAFARMNFLYQAAQLTAKISEANSLSNYYIKTLKEISKKVLERLHPDLKRTVCCVCNYSLTAGSEQINVKIKTNKKRKKNKSVDNRQDSSRFIKSKGNVNNSVHKYTKSRVEARNKRPNKICWSCSKCGYSRSFLQMPSHKLWIHEVQNKG